MHAVVNTFALDIWDERYKHTQTCEFTSKNVIAENEARMNF